MCNLYAMTRKDDDLGRFFRVSHNRRAAFQPANAIFPRHVAPVVRQSEDGEREIVLMNWGFLRLEKGRAPKPVTNVRDDQLRTNPFWRDSFAKRRCLVPASSFCEPNGDVPDWTQSISTAAQNRIRNLHATSRHRRPCESLTGTRPARG